MNKFMEIPALVMEKLNSDELIVLKGGNIPPPTYPNNGDGTCSGTNNGSGTCGGTNNGSGKCG